MRHAVSAATKAGFGARPQAASIRAHNKRSARNFAIVRNWSASALSLKEIAARLRPGVRIVTARDGNVAPGVALGLDAAAEDDLAARPSVHELEGEHDHDDFDSFVVALDPVGDGDGFRNRLTAAIRAHDILRVKGFVAVPGRDRRQIVQAVGDRVQQYFDRPWEPGETRATRLVVIGKKGLDRAAIAAALGG